LSVFAEKSSAPAVQLLQRQSVLEDYWVTSQQAQFIFTALFGSELGDFPASFVASDETPIDQHLWLDSRCLEGGQVCALRRAGYPVASRVSKLTLIHVPAFMGFLSLRAQSV
jgi:hypothetical protein